MDSDVSGVRRVSPGRHELSRDFVAQHQRERIFRGLAETVSEHGYLAVSVADIVKEARVARNTFYANFDSKQDCFLQAFDFVAEGLYGRIREAAERADADFPGRVRAGLAALLAYVVAEPALAHLALIDVLSAGSEATDRFESAVERFVPLLRAARELGPSGVALPEAMEETVIGGVIWIVAQRLGAGEAAEIEGLLPDLQEFVLTPYLGPEAARRAATT